jgi:transcription elongation factor Elf1
MAHFTITGVDIETGLDTDLVLDASDTRAAAIMASKRGVTVVSITEAAPTPAPATFACPHCRSEQIQKCSVAHAAGTSTGTIIGVAGIGDNLGVGIAGSNKTTNLAASCAPPKTPINTGFWITFTCMIIFSIASCAISCSMVDGSRLRYDAKDTYEGICVLGSIVIGIMIGLVAYFTIFNKSRAKQLMAHQIALAQWDRSWICHRCGHMFLI